MWEDNVNNFFSNLDESFITNFRELGKANGKMTAWNANESSTRWFKFLLFNRVREKNDTFFQNYNLLGNTSLGNPIFIKYKQIEINLDYLLGIEEFTFINKNLNFKEVKNVIEIGAGFGRTSHVLLKLVDSIDSYIIIDLPELIDISKKYLKSVLSDDLFSKISFYSNLDSRIEKLNSDLVLNINSFQEMSIDVIDYYMFNVIKKSKYFFSRNAIGKYESSSVNIDRTNLSDALDLGYCKEVIDIFNSDELSIQIERYLKKYKPFEDWSIISSEYDFFPYYYNVLYKNN